MGIAISTGSLGLLAFPPRQDYQHINERRIKFNGAPSTISKVLKQRVEIKFSSVDNNFAMDAATYFQPANKAALCVVTEGNH